MAKELRLKSVDLSTHGDECAIRYGTATIESRAIPQLMGGEKPVIRKILWAMYQMNLDPKAHFSKSSNVVGKSMKFHPHGDKSIYDALVGVANTPENKNVNCALISGKGNLGSLNSFHAASRYTEVRLSKFCWNNYFKFANQFEYINNYDGTDKEPISLPSNTCVLLINGNEGIAYGVSNKIPSFSLSSVNKLISKILKKKEKTDEKLSAKQIAKILEFELPYGGVAKNSEENYESLLKIITKGKGSIKFEPKYEVKNKSIIVTGFVKKLFGSNREEKLKNLPVVKEVYDSSSIENGNRWVIELKSSVNNKEIEKAVKKVISILSYTESYQINYLTKKIVEENGIKVDKTKFHNGIGIRHLIYHWVKLREQIETRDIELRIEKVQEKIEKLNLEKFGLDNRAILDQSREQNNPKEFLIQKLNIKDNIADYLLDFTVRRLTKISKKDIEKKLKENHQELKELKKNVKDDSFKRKSIIEKLKQLEK